LRHMSKIVSSYTTLAATFIIKQALKLSNLEALAEKYNSAVTADVEFIICEDECGCSGDCGSNWMRS
ncbi:hypothetical protein, partial [Muribaculum sp.]|uniref:hypothetical protein n=1 Tax=Muribaculum sp. TaxID=1918611 RepID=UPI0023D2FEE9